MEWWNVLKFWKKPDVKTKTLGELQRVFPLLIADLVRFAYREGFELAFDEAYRPPETAALYAKQGRGIKNSLHTKKLAIDLNLFKSGKYQTKSESYRKLGMYWKKLGTEQGLATCWGGEFSKPDGGHFSIEYKGVK